MLGMNVAEPKRLKCSRCDIEKVFSYSRIKNCSNLYEWCWRIKLNPNCTSIRTHKTVRLESLNGVFSVVWIVIYVPVLHLLLHRISLLPALIPTSGWVMMAIIYFTFLNTSVQVFVIKMKKSFFFSLGLSYEYVHLFSLKCGVFIVINSTE